MAILFLTPDFLILAYSALSKVDRNNDCNKASSCEQMVFPQIRVMSQRVTDGVTEKLQELLESLFATKNPTFSAACQGAVLPGDAVSEGRHPEVSLFPGQQEA